MKELNFVQQELVAGGEVGATGGVAYGDDWTTGPYDPPLGQVLPGIPSAVGPLLIWAAWGAYQNLASTFGSIASGAINSRFFPKYY